MRPLLESGQLGQGALHTSSGGPLSELGAMPALGLVLMKAANVYVNECVLPLGAV